MSRCVDVAIVSICRIPNGLPIEWIITVSLCAAALAFDHRDLEIATLSAAQKQLGCPGDAADQTARNLSTDFANISPRKLAGDRPGCRSGEHRHQKHEQTRITNQPE